MDVMRSAVRPGPRAGVVLLLVAATVVASRGPALAGANAGLVASLSWSASSSVPDRAPAPSETLYVRLARPGGLTFHGAELSLWWTPADSASTGAVTCDAIDYPTATTCTYLNRGTPLPIPNVMRDSVHVAWAMTGTSTGCTSGACLALVFTAIGPSPGTAGFALVSLLALDAAGKIDTALVSNPYATIGGNCPPRVFDLAYHQVAPGGTLTAAPWYFDPEGDALTWHGANLPPGAAVDPSTGVLTWPASPSEAIGTVYPDVGLIASDGHGEGAAVSWIAVVEPPYPFLTAWNTKNVACSIGLPCGLALTHDGILHLASPSANHISRWETNGRLVDCLTDSSGSYTGAYAAVGIDPALDIYVPTARPGIDVLSSTGRLVRTWGTAGTGDGQLTSPVAVACAAGDVFVVDASTCRVQRFTPQGAFVRAWGGPGSAPGQLQDPHGIAASPAGDVLYVADTGNDRIQEFTVDGVFVREFGTTGSSLGELRAPWAVAVDESAAVWVADTENDRVQKFSSTGAVRAIWGANGGGPGQFLHPKGIAAGIRSVYVADSENYRIQQFYLADPVAIGPGSAPAARGLDLVVTSHGEGLELAVSLDRPRDVVWTVTDALGRSVAGGDAGVLGAGTTRIPWSGRDARGRRVVSGIYWARVGAGGETVNRRAAVIH